MRNYDIKFPSGFPQTAMTGAYNDAGRPYWKMVAPYEILLDSCRLIVPKGFETDYASIPRPFWIKIPPCDPQYGPPAILHDFLCSNAILPWNVNADIFFSAMKYMQVDWFKRWCMYDAVRFAGICNPYADVDEILGFRGQCEIYMNTVPLCKTVEELAALAKQQKLSWVIPC
jgi:hypothetical protein